MPELPTMTEAGVPGYESAQWYGVLVPAGTPDEVINRLNVELATVVQGPNIKARLLKDATTIVSDTSPKWFESYLKAEIEKWAKVVKFSGARID